MKKVDICIIGGGISGLYLANELEKKCPNFQLLILEKNHYLGGRTRMEDFHGRKVVTGAGVGRWKKDILLQNLQERAEPQKKIKPITTRICYEFEHPLFTLDLIQELKTKKNWIQKHRHDKTFRDFFLTFYSMDTYRRFCWSNGYTDFEKADIVDTLYDYGFEDNVPGAKIFYVSWNKIIRYLRHQLKRTKIMLNTEFCRFEKSKESTEFLVWTTGCSIPIITKMICFAGSIERYPYPLVRKQIGYNSFLRLYAFLNEKDPLHKGTTYESNVFQKRVTLTPRLHMLSYSDNRHADRTNRLSFKQLESMSGYSMQDMKKFYWKHGTHFYRPLDPVFPSRKAFIQYAQNPEPGVYLVGEVISQNQGWTEGALESVVSVLSIIKKICIHNGNIFE